MIIGDKTVNPHIVAAETGAEDAPRTVVGSTLPRPVLTAQPTTAVPKPAADTKRRTGGVRVNIPTTSQPSSAPKPATEAVSAASPITTRPTATAARAADGFAWWPVVGVVAALLVIFVLGDAENWE